MNFITARRSRLADRAKWMMESDKLISIFILFIELLLCIGANRNIRFCPANNGQNSQSGKTFPFCKTLKVIHTHLEMALPYKDSIKLPAGGRRKEYAQKLKNCIFVPWVWKCRFYKSSFYNLQLLVFCMVYSVLI